MNAIAATLIVEPLWQRTRASFTRAIAALGTPAVIAAITLLTRELRAAIVARLHRVEHIVRKLLLAEAAELHRQQRAATARPNCAPRIQLIRLSTGLAHHFSPSPRGEGAGGGVKPGISICVHAADRVGEDRHETQRQSSAHHPTPNPLPSSGRGLARAIDQTNPESWRADFSFALPRDPRRVSDAHAPRIRALWGPDPKPELESTRTPRIINEEDSPFRLARRFEALRRVLQNPLSYAQRLARLLAAAVRSFPHAARTYAWATSRTNAYDPHDHRLGVEAYGPALDDWVAFEDLS